MKLHLYIVCVVSLLLCSCVSPVERRISRNPEIYNKLSANDKQFVQRREIREGMSRDAVFILWGQPARISNGKRDGKSYERWSYVDYEPVYRTSFYGGVGLYGGCGYPDPFFSGGPTVDYVPMQGASVEFVNGKVTGFLVPRH